MNSLKNATNESQLQQGLFNAMTVLPTIPVRAESKRPQKEKETNILQKLVHILNFQPRFVPREGREMSSGFVCYGTSLK